MKKLRKVVIISILLLVTFGAFSAKSYAENEDKEKVKAQNVTNNIYKKTHQNGIYKIAIGKDSNKTLEVSGSNKNNDAKIGIWNYGNATAQKFYFEYQEKGYYKITAMHTGKSLTVKNDILKDGTEIVQSDYVATDGQKWILRDTNKNGWVISLLSNPELSISVDGQITNGAKIILSKTADNDNQMMYIFNISDDEKTHQNGIYKIAIGKDSNKTLEVSGSNKNNNAKIGIWNYGNAMAQKFYFEYQEGYYKIKAMHTGKSLTVKDNILKAGTEIVQSDYVGSDNQKWILRDTNKNGWVISLLSNPDLSISVEGQIQNGAKIILSKTADNDNQMMYIFNISNSERTHKDDIYKIAIGKDSNKTLEVSGSNINNNAKIGIWDYGKADAQKFKFEYIDGYYKITAKHTGKSLTVKNNNLKEETDIVQSDYIGADGQKWVLRDTNKNGWILSPLFNPDLAVSVEGQITNGAKMILSKTLDNDNQMLWIMPPIDKGIEEGIYGKSGLIYKGTGGSYLKYYKIGTGKNHLILNFSIHGYEDSYSRDGKELTYLAEQFYDYMKDYMSDDLIEKWTIYVLPNLNPDGQNNGWTNDGPGRTTVYSWAPGHQGIDMNRCFPVGYTRAYSERNYNGTQPMQAFEAEHLRDFILNHTGSKNIIIDIHGWLNETIGDNGIGSFYREQFGISKHIATYGNGYLIQWARTIPNTRSMLLELPEVKSHSELINRKYVDKFNRATLNLLKNY